LSKIAGREDLRRNAPLTQPDAAHVAALMRAAIDDNGGPAAMRLLGEHRRQVPAGLSHGVAPQFENDPPWRHAFGQCVQFRADDGKIEFAFLRSIRHAEAAAEVDDLRNDPQHIRRLERLFDAAAQVMDDAIGSEDLRAREDVKPDHLDAAARMHQLAAFGQVVLGQSKA